MICVFKLQQTSMPFIKNVLSSLKNIHFQSLLGNGVMAVFNMITTAILFRALSVYDAGVYFFFYGFFTTWLIHLRPVF